MPPALHPRRSLQTNIMRLTGPSGSITSSGAAQYSFKSSAFFGGKMNVRSSVVRVAQESSRGDMAATGSAAAAQRQPAGTAPRRTTLVEQYSLDTTRHVSFLRTVNPHPVNYPAGNEVHMVHQCR